MATISIAPTEFRSHKKPMASVVAGAFIAVLEATLMAGCAPVSGTPLSETRRGTPS
jgi:hypothetical protein